MAELNPTQGLNFGPLTTHPWMTKLSESLFVLYLVGPSCKPGIWRMTVHRPRGRGWWLWDPWGRGVDSNRFDFPKFPAQYWPIFEKLTMNKCPGLMPVYIKEEPWTYLHAQKTGLTGWQPTRIDGPQTNQTITSLQKPSLLMHPMLQFQLKLPGMNICGM